MKKKHDFFSMDMMTANELCFRCERCCSPDKMCSWFREEQPVPGWIALTADDLKSVQAFKVLRCPLFLDARDDPGMTQAEYAESCHGLLVELYKKVQEYKEACLKAEKARSSAAGQLKTLKKAHSDLEVRYKRLQQSSSTQNSSGCNAVEGPADELAG